MIFLNHDDSKALSILFVEKAKNTVNVESQSEICKRINEFMNEKVITDFSDLILLSFPKMASIVDRIEQDQIGYENECFEEGKLNNFYQMYIECYDHLIKRMNKKKKLSIHIVDSLGISICPYCNREYINSRGGDTAGAQMDHYFSKKDYPWFSLSLNNLVPCCGNCNRVKSEKSFGISPFDDSLKGWKWDDQQIFRFEQNSLDSFEVKLDVDFSTLNKDIKKKLKDNFVGLKLEKAYSIHSKEVKKWHDLNLEYGKTQLEEISRKLNISEETLRKMIYGIDYSELDLRNEPLAKFKHDILRQLKIINGSKD